MQDCNEHRSNLHGHLNGAQDFITTTISLYNEILQTPSLKKDKTQMQVGYSP